MIKFSYVKNGILRYAYMLLMNVLCIFIHYEGAMNVLQLYYKGIIKVQLM